MIRFTTGSGPLVASGNCPPPSLVMITANCPRSSSDRFLHPARMGIEPPVVATANGPARPGIRGSAGRAFGVQRSHSRLDQLAGRGSERGIGPGWCVDVPRCCGNLRSRRGPGPQPDLRLCCTVPLSSRRRGCRPSRRLRATAKTARCRSTAASLYHILRTPGRPGKGRRRRPGSKNGPASVPGTETPAPESGQVNNRGGQVSQSSRVRRSFVPTVRARERSPTAGHESPGCRGCTCGRRHRRARRNARRGRP